MNRLAPWLAWVALGCTPLDATPISEVADVGVGSDSGRPLPLLQFPEGEAPPPIAGGTLEVSPDGVHAVVADPDRGRIQVVDLTREVVTGSVPVGEAEPGRAVVTDHQAYVVLRRDGVVVIDLATGAESARYQPCPAPRGVALEGDVLWVTCLGGDVVQLDRHTGQPQGEPIHLAPDLRDIVRHDGEWWISRFRSAEIIRLRDDGHHETHRPPTPGGEAAGLTPRVGWRLRALGDGRIGLLHQLHGGAPLSTDASAYRTDPLGCTDGPVHSALTIFGPDGVVEQHRIAGLVLPVDFAFVGATIALAVPGQWHDGSLRLIDLGDAALMGCLNPRPGDEGEGQATAVVAVNGRFWFQTREPARLIAPRLPFNPELARASISLNGPPVFDSGHDLFHVDAGGGIACASCHPEGGDDGHTWHFDGLGLRRTLPLYGPLSPTLPLHWNGEFERFDDLLHDVFVGRMGGRPLEQAHADRLSAWLDRIVRPVYRVPLVDEALPLGRQVFDLYCAGCHAGDHLTDNNNHETFAGQRFQTPALRALALRDALFHHGCDGALATPDRFLECAREAHGAMITDEWRFVDHPAQVAAIVEFLKTL